MTAFKYTQNPAEGIEAYAPSWIEGDTKAG